MATRRLVLLMLAFLVELPTAFSQVSDADIRKITEIHHRNRFTGLGKIRVDAYVPPATEKIVKSAREIEQKIELSLRSNRVPVDSRKRRDLDENMIAEFDALSSLFCMVETKSYTSGAIAYSFRLSLSEDAFIRRNQEKMTATVWILTEFGYTPSNLPVAEAFDDFLDRSMTKFCNTYLKYNP